MSGHEFEATDDDDRDEVLADMAVAEMVRDWRARRRTWRATYRELIRRAREHDARLSGLLPDAGAKPAYRGVFRAGGDSYRAVLKVLLPGNLRHHSRVIGTFPTAIEAARAHDEAARDFYGPAAILNFPDESREVAS